MSSRLKKSRLEGNQVLMLTPLSLRLFEALRIRAPASTEDLIATLEEVEHRLSLRQKDVTVWEQKRKEALERKLTSDVGKAKGVWDARCDEAERKRALELQQAAAEKKEREQLLEAQRREAEAEAEAEEEEGGSAEGQPEEHHAEQEPPQEDGFVPTMTFNLEDDEEIVFDLGM